MQVLNSLGKDISLTEGMAQFDETAKRLIADRQILAWILRWCAIEFQDCEISEIIKCIQDPVLVSTVRVEPGLTNRIRGEAQESAVPGEGAVYYDIRFSAVVPGSCKSEKASVILRINIEAQKSFYPGYDLVTRGIFYGGRMLSEQMGTVISGQDDYDNLEKVYSIFICMNTPDKLANTISVYEIVHEAYKGVFKDTARCDLLRVVMIRLPKEGREYKAKNQPCALHKLLLTLLSNQKKAEEKRQELLTEFNVKTSENMLKELNNMCNLSEIVFEDALEKGLKAGMEEGMKKGLEQGEKKTIFELVCEGDLPSWKGASKLGLSAAEFLQEMKAAGFETSHIIN